MAGMMEEKHVMTEEEVLEIRYQSHSEEDPQETEAIEDYIEEA